MNTDFLFVYFNGRENRLLDKIETPEEFFYGLQYFKRKGYKVDLLEYTAQAKGLSNKILKILEEIIFFLFSFRYDFSSILNKSSFKKIKETKHVVISNTRIAHALIPFILFSKLIKSKTIFSVFAMGMFNINSKNRFKIKVHKILHSILINLVDNLIFIGENEYININKMFKNKNKKLHFIPFGVDNKFWKLDESINKEHILFIGNDSNRDFTFLIDLVKKLPNIKFKIISEKITDEVSNLNNVQLFKGSWNKNLLDDSFLKNCYKNAFLSIIPLKESLQPSGQSVALQSMSMEVPVIITKTKGFWDTKYFKHMENIYFIEKNDSKEWIEAIHLLTLDSNLQKTIAKNAKVLIDDLFNCINFGNNLTKVLLK